MKKQLPQTVVGNVFHVHQVGTFSPVQHRISPTTDLSKYGYMQVYAEYIRFGSNVNQAGNVHFIEIRSTGNAGDNVSFLKPTYLAVRTNSNNIVDGTIYNLNGVATIKQGGTVQSIVSVKTGTSTPVSVVTPDFIGQEYIDTTAKVAYKACGITSADWKQITN